MFNLPWYLSNSFIYSHLKLKTVKGEISYFSENYLEKLHEHKHLLAINLLDNSLTEYSRLKRFVFFFFYLPY